MEHYIVKGGNSLSGEVEIAGAKNAALAILAASIMTNETVTVENVPDVSDIRAILKTIEVIGGYVEKVDRHTFRINGSGISKDTPVDNEYVRKIRGSYYLIGSLLGKYRKADVALPGGCNIGLRPIDQHIKGFRALGASVRLASGRVAARADRLVGSHIYMDVVSVGATINIIMAAVMAEGSTTIENAAKEPHVVDLATRSRREPLCSPLRPQEGMLRSRMSFPSTWSLLQLSSLRSAVRSRSRMIWCVW